MGDLRSDQGRAGPDEAPQAGLGYDQDPRRAWPVRAGFGGELPAPFRGQKWPDERAEAGGSGARRVHRPVDPPHAGGLRSRNLVLG